MDENSQKRGETRTVGSVETTLDIIEALIEQREATMTELTDVLDYSKSSIHSHLHTLEKHEYVVRNGYEYRPSLKFFKQGQQIMQNNVVVFETGKNEIRDIAIETGEDGWIMVEENGFGIYVYRQRGEQGLDDFPIGEPSGLHCTASGKAILAHLPEERITEILDRHGLPKITDNTITTREELFEELEAISDSGVAISRGESIPGISAVATPILSPNGQVLGSISISGPSSRLTDARIEGELADKLRECSNIIEIKTKEHNQDFTD